MSDRHPPLEIKFTADARQDVAALDGSVTKRLKRVLEQKIAVAPADYGLPLRGALAGYWKHQFASHRLIYKIYESDGLVVVCAVGLRQGLHQSDIYQQLDRAAKTGRLAEQVSAILNLIEKKPRTP